MKESAREQKSWRGKNSNRADKVKSTQENESLRRKKTVMLEREEKSWSGKKKSWRGKRRVGAGMEESARE